MPRPVRHAASTPRTAAPGYATEPVRTPSTPREYLSSPATGVRITSATSRADQLSSMARPYPRSLTHVPAVLALHGPRHHGAQSPLGRPHVPVQRRRRPSAGVAPHAPRAVRLG